MAKQFLTSIDLNKNELQNVALQSLATPPATPATGQLYLNTAGSINQPTYYNGTDWLQLATRATNTFSGKQTLATPSATVTASLNLPAGADNTAVSGDVYNASNRLKFHNGSAEKNLAFSDDVTYIGTTSVALNRGSGALALAGITVNGLTVSTSTGTLTIADTKTFTVNNTLTISGTDGSTLAIGTGGTLGTAAYTAATDYATTATTLNSFAAPSADVAMNNKKITGLATCTEDTDAANKGYVDAVKQGLDIKDSVRVASTENITIASALVDGVTIDEVVVATGDRVLLKNQSTASQNGIYVVAASGAASRSTDANTTAKVSSGMYVFVSEGTASADAGYVLTTNDPITLGSTGLSFTQFSGAGQITAGSGLDKLGNTLSVKPDTGGTSGLSVSSTGVKVDPTVALGAANTYVARRIGFLVGDGAETSYVLTHSLGNRGVAVSVYRNSTPWDEVGVDVEKTTTNTVTLRFSVAPTTDQFAVSIVG